MHTVESERRRRVYRATDDQMISVVRWRWPRGSMKFKSMCWWPCFCLMCWMVHGAQCTHIISKTRYIYILTHFIFLLFSVSIIIICDICDVTLDSNDPNQIISTNEAGVETVSDRPSNIFDSESQTQAPRDDDDDSFFIPDETSGPLSAPVLKKWVSIVLNNKVATLAVVALATTFGFAIAVLYPWTGPNNIETSKAKAMTTECDTRRLHDTKPHHIAVAPEAAVPSWEGRKLFPLACTTTINPPDTATISNCVGSSDPGNSNVLQQAINDASDNDVICMNPGKYYTACQTHVTKPLTILGACAGVNAPGDPNFNPTSGARTGCTASGETVWVASNEFNTVNGGLQGIFVDTSDVTIDGIAFHEETETFRRTVGVLCDASSGSYENIKVLNNYMKAAKISATCPIGGADSSLFPKTITNLEYK